MQELVRHITYQNIGETSLNVNRSVEFVLSDGTGAVSEPAMKNVNILVGNNAPVARDDFISVPSLAPGVKISFATLLANDDDSDGDPLTITTVSPTSDHSGEITTYGPWVLYTPPDGFEGVDIFVYVIGDGKGATATATVTLSSTSSQQGQGRTIMKIVSPGPDKIIRLFGTPGQRYSIEYTSRLSDSSWTILGEVLANEIGEAQFRDVLHGEVMRFYRCVSLPPP